MQNFLLNFHLGYTGQEFNF